MTASDYLDEAIEQLTSNASDHLADRSVAVIGAGTMGTGIALAAIRSGYKVVLSDADDAALARARSWIDKEYGKALERGGWKADPPARTLSTISTLDALGEPDIVIEAVFESLAIKQQVFRELDKRCPAHTLLGSNTSTLDIDAIAGATRRPGSFVGLHFFSPAHVMPLLEIVRGKDTSAQSILRAEALSKRLGKVGVVVGNCYGFAGNRMIEGVFREIDRLLLEGARPETIDFAMEDFGMAMGPCRVLDLVGLDVPYKARRENSQAAPGDDAYYALCDAMVERGWLGRKSGRGFYSYADGAASTALNPEVDALSRDLADRLGIRRRVSIDLREIVDRFTLPWSLEAARLVDEGIVAKAEHADVIATLGYGYPRERGGPLYYARSTGEANIVSRVSLYAAGRESYWRPSSRRNMV